MLKLLLPLFLLCAGPARALLTVDTLADPLTPPAGNCTLRAAITAINSATAQGGCPAGAAGDSINFSVTGTLTLTASLPVVSSSMMIQGPAAPSLAIDGGNKFSLFVITADGVNFFLSGLTLTRGMGPVGGGGAVAVGGPAAIPATSVTVNGVEFVANGGRFGGAIDLDGGATVNVNASTFEGNLTANFGGAVDVFSGTFTAVNCTFYGNLAASSSGGGAVYVSTNGNATLTNCTLAANTAPSGAAAGGALKQSGGTLSLRNCVIAGNSSALDDDVAGTITSLGYNLVQSRGASSGWSPTDLPDGTNPALQPLSLYIPGSTKTMAIFNTSPAFNAVPSPGCNGGPAVDQRGYPRPQGAGCDAGAYERAPLPQEVSAFPGNALKVRKGTTPGLVVLDFEDQPSMSGYNVYEGNLPVWVGPYSHGSAPGNACNVGTTYASGRRTTPAAGIGSSGSHYYLVTSFFTTTEGPSGFNSSSVEIPPSLNTCAP